MDFGLVDRTSPPEMKIALFRSLFRGRDDVYARRFENRRTGKSGYAPACANEWVRGICEKPRVKFKLHLVGVEYLQNELATPFAGKTVVITHHLPSMRSVSEQYKQELTSCAFASNHR